MQSKSAQGTILTNATAVVVANEFNLSIFKAGWLEKQGVVSENEYLDGYLFSPGVIKIPTKRFALTVLPNRVQLEYSPQYAALVQSELIERLKGIVETLPHTPFTAVGFNFDFVILGPAVESFGDWNKRVFAPDFVKKRECATDPASRFGTYFSIDHLEMRLRVTIRPASFKNGNPELGLPAGTEVMNAAFNFHRDLDDDSNVKIITRMAGNWDAFLEKAELILDQLH